MEELPEYDTEEECCMTAPEQNGVFVMGPKKDAIKPVSVKSLMDEINKVRQYTKTKE